MNRLYYASLLAAFHVILSHFTLGVIATGAWAWKGGSNASLDYYNSGVYNAIGNPGFPQGREGSASWVDHSGLLWLFGGDSYTGLGSLNDLWKYDTNTGNWTWVEGSEEPVNFGTYPANIPGTGYPSSRVFPAFWTDKAGNFWLFGGSVFNADMFEGPSNDLWKYNGTWTIYGGSSTPFSKGTYPQNIGELGYPGGTYQAATWTDLNGNLWLFGGTGETVSSGSNAQGAMDSLWKYTISSNTWTWMGGSTAFGELASATFPGSRQLASTWTDHNGTLWLFGGLSLAYGGSFFYYQPWNDLWAYNITSGSWKMVAGNNYGDPQGTFPAIGKPGNPGSRSGASSWVDATGQLWLFGGQNYIGETNDLWVFSMATSNWTLIAGTNNVDDPGDYPDYFGGNGLPAARRDATSWTDAQGKLWLFGGGAGFGGSALGIYLNDLWVYYEYSSTSTTSATSKAVTTSTSATVASSVSTTKATTFSTSYAVATSSTSAAASTTGTKKATTTASAYAIATSTSITKLSSSSTTKATSTGTLEITSSSSASVHAATVATTTSTVGITTSTKASTTATVAATTSTVKATTAATTSSVSTTKATTAATVASTTSTTAATVASTTSEVAATVASTTSTTAATVTSTTSVVAALTTSTTSAVSASTASTASSATSATVAAASSTTSAVAASTSSTVVTASTLTVAASTAVASTTGSSTTGTQLATTTIFDDSIEGNWDTGLSSSPLQIETNYVHAGSSAIVFNASNDAALVFYLPGGINTNVQTKLTFYVSGGNSSGQAVGISLINVNLNNGTITATNPFSVAGTTSAGYIAKSWQSGGVTFSLHFPAGNYDGFWFKDTSGKVQPPVYFDNVVLYQNV